MATAGEATSPRPRFCEQCGHRLGDGARFCGGCGAPVAEQRADQQPAEKSRRGSTTIARVAGGILAACFVLFTLIGEKSQRDAVIDWIDAHLYGPVEAINPRSTIGEFYSHVYQSCDSYDALRGSCSSNGIGSMIVRIPGAILSTAGYVLAQGPVAIIIVGVSVLLYLGLVASDKDTRGALVNPYAWLILFPLFTGLCAWAVQLVILLLLVMLKSFIAALAVLGVGYVLFEKFKLWDEMRKLFDRGFGRLTGKSAPQRAG